jgi:hypothetical protein
VPPSRWKVADTPVPTERYVRLLRRQSLLFGVAHPLFARSRHGGNPRKSTLAIPEEEIGDLERHVGSLNTCTDCFALSLFHILDRQPEWQDPFASFSTHRPQTSPVTQLLPRFTRSIGEGTPIAFPDLRRILHGTCQLLKNIPAIAKPDCRC